MVVVSGGNVTSTKVGYRRFIGKLAFSLAKNFVVNGGFIMFGFGNQILRIHAKTHLKCRKSY